MSRSQAQKEKLLKKVEEVHNIPNAEQPANPWYNSKLEQIRDMTNLSLVAFQSLVREIGRIWPRRRGCQPRYGIEEHLMVFLRIFSTGSSMSDLALDINLNERLLVSMVHRIRPLLHQVLRNRWLDNPIRPKLLESVPAQLANVGAIIDGTPWRIPRPSFLSFGEAKTWYSGHRKAYCVNGQVVIRAQDPPYAVMIGNAVPGSESDINSYRRLIPTLDQYLVAKENEGVDRWALLADRGYYGPAEGNHQRVFGFKPPKTESEKTYNKEINNVRVKIERFFGLTAKLWSIIMTPYPFSLENLQVDFEIVHMLTNEVILDRGDDLALSEADGSFYAQHLELVGKDLDLKREKHRISSRESAKKRRMLRRVDAVAAAAVRMIQENDESE